MKGVRPVIGLVCVAAFVAACGGSQGNTPIGRGTPLPTPTPSALATAVAAHPTDKTVSLNLVMYPAGSACASVQTTTPLSQVNSDCALLWVDNPVSSVPGDDVMNAAPVPRQAAVSAEIPADQGAAEATAFARWEVLTIWAQTNNLPDILQTLDGSFSAQDGVLAAMRSGGYVNAVPDCQYPSSIRVVTADPRSLSYLQAHGWPGPTQTAIVATFPACEGTKIGFQTGPQLVAPAAHPYSQVITGTAEDAGAFGTLWQVTGYANCGPPELATLCS